MKIIEIIFSYISANLTIIKDVVTIATLSIGSYVALRGLEAWKVTLKGKQDYNLAKSICKNLYKYRVLLIYFRSPVLTSEYQKELDEINFKDRNDKGIPYAYQNRWEKILKIKLILQELLLESRVLWGDVLEINFKNLFQLEADLESEIKKFLNARKNGGDIYNTKIINNGDKLEDDSFLMEVNKIINNVENILKPHLKL